MKARISVLLLLLARFCGAGFSNEEMVFRVPPPETAPPPAAAAPTILDSYEFNGFMKIGGEVKVSITDTKARKSYWLELEGPAVNGVRLQQFLRKGESIIIASGGSIKQLDLKKAKIEPLRVAADQPPAQGGVSPMTAGMGPMPSVTASNVQPVETDEEVRIRMQKVAEEIRRRRAERRQMIEQRQQGSGN